MSNFGWVFRNKFPSSIQLYLLARTWKYLYIRHFSATTQNKVPLNPLPAFLPLPLWHSICVYGVTINARTNRKSGTQPCSWREDRLWEKQHSVSSAHADFLHGSCTKNSWFDFSHNSFLINICFYSMESSHGNTSTVLVFMLAFSLLKLGSGKALRQSASGHFCWLLSTFYFSGLNSSPTVIAALNMWHSIFVTCICQAYPNPSLVVMNRRGL